VVHRQRPALLTAERPGGGEILGHLAMQDDMRKLSRGRLSGLNAGHYLSDLG